jgi:hypothetical protein
MAKTLAILENATRTTPGSSQVFTNEVAEAAVLTIDVSALSGTSPSLVVTLLGIDPVSGKAYPILETAAITAVGTVVLRIGRGLAASAGLVANDILPHQFRVGYTIAGTTPSISFSLGASLS